MEIRYKMFITLITACIICVLTIRTIKIKTLETGKITFESVGLIICELIAVFLIGSALVYGVLLNAI